jgi:RimJ/RimL family protein N-acetyltransferase
MRLVVSQPKVAIAQFVSQQIGEGNHLPWQEFSAIALVDEKRILAGVVYNQYSQANICMHVGALPGRHWLCPEFLFAAFDYPFRILNLRRVTGLVPRKNKDAIRFDEHLGFVLEGCLEEALPNDDLLIYGMLKRNCKWISDEFCGKLQRRHLRRLPIGQLAVA